MFKKIIALSLLLFSCEPDLDENGAYETSYSFKELYKNFIDYKYPEDFTLPDGDSKEEREAEVKYKIISSLRKSKHIPVYISRKNKNTNTKDNVSIDFSLTDVPLEKIEEDSDSFLGLESKELSTIILYSGNGAAGHYVSLRKIQGDWFLYDSCRSNPEIKTTKDVELYFSNNSNFKPVFLLFTEKGEGFNVEKYSKNFENGINQCYLNSSLQLLLGICSAHNPYADIFEDNDDNDDNNSTDEIRKIFNRLIEENGENRNDLSSLRKQIKEQVNQNESVIEEFSLSKHEDVADFFRALLNALGVKKTIVEDNSNNKLEYIHLRPF
jgi:ubiquitin C-terminal hydrolase